jgi:hypothetical protein
MANIMGLAVIFPPSSSGANPTHLITGKNVFEMSFTTVRTSLGCFVEDFSSRGKNFLDLSLESRCDSFGIL